MAWSLSHIVVVQTALVYPGVLFGIMFLLNFFVWAEEASNAIPFGTMLVMCKFSFERVAKQFQRPHI